MQNPCLPTGSQQELLCGSAHSHEGAGHDAVSLQSLKESRIPIGDTIDDELAVLLYFGEWFENCFDIFPFRAGMQCP